MSDQRTPPSDLGSVPDAETLAHLDMCCHSSCPGGENDPEFPALICTLPLGHDGMHHQEDVDCSWWRPE